MRLVPILGVVLAVSAIPARGFAADDDDEKKKPVAEGAAAVSPDRYPPFSTRFKVLAAGLVVTGAAWGVSYGISRAWPEQRCHVALLGPVYPDGKTPCASGPPGYNQLAIPIAGPWIALARSGCPTDNPTCSGGSIAGRGVAYVLDGLVQLAGLALMVQAAVMKTEPADSPKKTSAFALRYRGVEVRPLPIATPSGGGVGLVGTF
jgi:hypothetical protein